MGGRMDYEREGELDGTWEGAGESVERGRRLVGG